MNRNPLKEIKKLNNEIMRSKINTDFEILKHMNFSQVQILKYILDKMEESEDIYQKDLESALNIRKSTVSGILDTMEKNNIIKRQHISGKTKVILSDCALEKHAEIINNLKMLESRITYGIHKEDLEIFYKVVDQMRENIKGDDSHA